MERLRPRRRLLPLCPEDGGFEPEDPRTMCEPKPYPLYLYALFSITCQLALKCHLIHVALPLVGSG